MRWSSIRDLGNSKIVKQSYIWIFVVPFLAKCVLYVEEAYPGSESVSGFFTESWFVLYFSAVCFAVGVTIYLVFCPGIIRNYKDYSDFDKTGATHERINLYLKKLYKMGGADDCTLEKIKELSEECNTDDIDAGRSVVIEVFDHSALYNLRKENLRDVFWLVYDQSDRSRCLWSSASGFCFYTGFLLLLVLFLQNFISVARLLLE